MSKYIFFTIIVPVFNVNKHIERCIETIKAQTYHNFEVVFVDDCGSDGSIRHAEKYAQHHDNVRIIYHKKNLGTYHARHTGALVAEGDYLVFLDPDDEIKKDLLLKLTGKVTTQPDIIFYGVEFVPKRHWYKKKAFLYALENSSSVPESIYNRRSKEFLWGATPGKCYSRLFYLSVIENLAVTKDLRFVYMEDNLLFYSAIFSKISIENVYYDGYIYYKHDSSISKLNRNKDIALQLEQYDFFLSKLYSSANKGQLSLKERMIFDALFDFLRANFYLISRYQGGKSYYINCLQSSNRLDFKLRKLFAIFLCRLTFGKIKV